MLLREIMPKNNNDPILDVTPVDNPDDIESIANENSYNQDPSLPLVFGGVVFNNVGSGDIKKLNYTLRLSTDFTQRLSNFLFMPYSFSGPQNNGEDYDLFCSFQTLIDLTFIEKVTGETLIPTGIASITNLNWVKHFCHVMLRFYL